MSNINKIFGLFDDSEDVNQPQEAVYVNFMDTPKGKIGMFVKLIQNNIVFRKKLRQFFKQIDQPFDEELTKKNSEFTIFNRAWHYIKQVDLQDHDALAAIVTFEPSILLDCLNRAIKFFEFTEEYEKCGHMHKIAKLVKKL